MVDYFCTLPEEINTVMYTSYIKILDDMKTSTLLSPTTILSPVRYDDFLPPAYSPRCDMMGHIMLSPTGILSPV